MQVGLHPLHLRLPRSARVCNRCRSIATWAMASAVDRRATALAAHRARCKPTKLACSIKFSLAAVMASIRRHQWLSLRVSEGKKRNKCIHSTLIILRVPTLKRSKQPPSPHSAQSAPQLTTYTNHHHTTPHPEATPSQPTPCANYNRKKGKVHQARAVKVRMKIRLPCGCHLSMGRRVRRRVSSHSQYIFDPVMPSIMRAI